MRTCCTIIFLLFECSLFLLASPGQAEEITTISPSWEGFTSPHGQGLYHDILRAIFTPRGDTLSHLEVPAKRGRLMLSQSRADIYMCIPEGEKDFLLADQPMYEGEFHALFLRQKFPNWDDVTSMANTRVIWRLGYYTPENFPVAIVHSETTTGIEALQKVLRGQADFYVDDRKLILESMRSYPAPFDGKACRIESVGFRQYFPGFASTERGRELRRIYDEGMRTLSREGKLKPLFEKWNLPMPRMYQ